MRRITGPGGQVGRECRRAGWIVEAVQEAVKRCRLQLCVELWRVLDRVRDAAEEVGCQHCPPKLTRQDPDAEGEGA